MVRTCSHLLSGIPHTWVNRFIQIWQRCFWVKASHSGFVDYKHDNRYDVIKFHCLKWSINDTIILGQNRDIEHDIPQKNDLQCCKCARFLLVPQAVIFLGSSASPSLSVHFSDRKCFMVFECFCFRFPTLLCFQSSLIQVTMASSQAVFWLPIRYP